MSPSTMTLALLVTATLVYSVDGRAVEVSTHATAVEDVDFTRDVRPLLARKCFACHGNDEHSRAAGLRLDRREDAVASRGTYAALVPGAPDESELWLRVSDPFDPMPPADAGEPLAPEELEVLRRWIESGAPYSQHWAFVAPERSALPTLSEADPNGPAWPVDPQTWVRTGVDAFVGARLEAEGLAPSPEADPATLLRRVSLDLTGLPPTVDEARGFLALMDTQDPMAREAAYAAEVERLLSSPRYGERWAAMWLDLARYADSAGHGSDPLRTIWRYRDWVIDAFDRNLPLDEFSRLQLAGDLLAEPSVETRLATAFHRNTMTNTEGGTDDEEFRVQAIKDRVNTTGQVWLGLTVGCAECHSHKYDPLSQREYYALFDFFNHTADTDRNDDAPRLATPTAAQAAEHQRLDAALAAVALERARCEPDLEAGAARLAALEQRWHPVAARDAPVETTDGTRVDTLTWRYGDEVGGVPIALRVRALAAESLPGGGPGQSPDNGNFVLTDIALRAEGPPVEAASAIGRLRLELPGRARILSLAEVELLDAAGARIRGGVARQSSTDFGGDAARALDGNTDGSYDADSVTHTRTEDDPWWEVEFETPVAPVAMASMQVWNRTDGELETRLAGLVIVLFDDAGVERWRSAPWPTPWPVERLTFTPQSSAPVRLEAHSFSFAQKSFPLAAALDGDPRTGWAIGPEQGRDHEAVFRIEQAPKMGAAVGAAATRWVLTLRQEFGGEHVLGRYAIDIAGSSASPQPNGGTHGAFARARPSALRRAASRSPLERDDDDRVALREQLLQDDPARLALLARRAALEAERDALGVTSTPVMVELEGDARRVSHVLHKGNFLEPGEVVLANTPATLHPFGERSRDRAGLADWLFDDANPLTARVFANRLWARLFGRGLVLTEDDFGSQGALPTHPELLDWLAVELRDGGWDQRAFFRTLVLSSTYRQSSRVSSAQRERDPDGALYARFPRQRLEAEMVRDTALAAAGLLSDKKFGPSVFPPQPPGIWQAAFNGERDWTESRGEDRWRRGLYVFLRRTAPYPMLQTFDAPTREVCTLLRPRTNTPLQAFVTLNDPVFLEAAQALGRAMARAQTRATSRATSREESDRAGLELGLWRALQRPPAPEHVAVLQGLLDDARLEFRADLAGARAFAASPQEPSPMEPAPLDPSTLDLSTLDLSLLGPWPAGLAPDEAAAWTLVASTVLNLDAALSKE